MYRSDLQRYKNKKVQGSIYGSLGCKHIFTYKNRKMISSSWSRLFKEMSNQNEEILLHFQKCKNLEMHGRQGISFPLQIFILGHVPSSYYTFPLDVSLSNAYA